MKIIFIIIFFLAVLATGVVWYMDRTERHESYFSTYKDLSKSELIGKGWVPDFIPKSAYDIYEKHRVDIGRVNVKFKFKPNDTAQIEEACSQYNGEEQGVTLYKMQ